MTRTDPPQSTLARTVTALAAALALVAVTAAAGAPAAAATVGVADGSAATAAAGSPVGTAAPTLAANESTVAPGDRAVVAVTLSGAPDGVAGYELTVGVANGSVARIVDARYPEAVGVTSEPEVGDSGETVVVRGLDAGESIEAGATDVVLAYVVVEGVAPGETAVTVRAASVDDDDGAAIEPEVAAGTVAVGASSTGDGTTAVGGGGSTDAAGTASGTDADGATTAAGNESGLGGSEGSGGPITFGIGGMGVLALLGVGVRVRRAVRAYEEQT